MLPLEVVHLGPKAFYTTVVGLAWQLAELVMTIENARPGLTWYVADMQTIGTSPVATRGPAPVVAGDAFALIHAVGGVQQFESGVFAGAPGAIGSPVFRPGGLWTEDEETADLGDAVVEVRAFDTSFWSVATNDPEILSSVVRRFPESGIASA